MTTSGHLAKAMAASLKKENDVLIRVGNKAEHFVKMNNIRIHSSEVVLSIIGMNCHITGSRSEGVHQGDSDTDILIYDNDIEAVHETEGLNDSDGVNVKVENTRSNPGYAMLKVNTNDIGRNICLLQFINQPIKFLCNNIEGSYYLSTSKAINAMSIYAAFKLPWTGGTLTFEENSGPAKHVTVEMGNKKSDLDILYTIQCKDQSMYMAQWQQRSRVWPPEDIVNEIMMLPVFLVPLGHPLSGDATKDNQWKFSFNLQERTLMRSLKGAQIVCYNLLKNLKHHLKEIHDSTKSICGIALKSYYFKTCFLWSLEKIGASDWSEQKIVQNAIGCIQHLLHCLKKKQCPHYFIPENNLFEGKDIVLRDSSDLEKFLISICDEKHHLWEELLSKVLLMFNKSYMQKQPMLNCVSVCRHLLVLSVKENNHEVALQKIMQRYQIVNSFDVKTGLFERDWKHSILLTLQSVMASLQCTLQMEGEKVHQGEDTYYEKATKSVNRNMANKNKMVSDSEEQCWKRDLNEACKIDFCSGRLKQATVQYWLKDFTNANMVTKRVIDRNAVNIMHHTGFNHIRDETFKDEENSTKEWSSLVKENVYFDVLFIPGEILVCPPAIQLQLCEGRGVTVNPLVYAYYLQFCIMQKDGTASQEIKQLLSKWQMLLDEKKRAGFNYIDFELISYSYLVMGNYDNSLQNLQKGATLRDTGSAHYWMLGLLIFHHLNEMPKTNDV